MLAQLYRVFSFLALAFWASLASADTQIQGRLEMVIDGDTIVVRGIKIRLNGLHAPEWNQPGGSEATNWMRATYGGQRLICVLNGKRSYDRYIGICYGPRGDDIAAGLVAAGLGRDCPRYSGGRYRQFETANSRRFQLPSYCR